MNGFNGILSQDSPALYGALRRITLSTGSFQAIEAAYKEVWSQGGCLEQLSKRTANSSFNPRPARMACLLLQHLESADTEMITSALQASLLATPPSDPILAAIWLLDYIRHLHLDSNPALSMAELTSKVTSLTGLPTSLQTTLSTALHSYGMLHEE